MKKFKSHPSRYRENMEDSRTVAAAPADIMGPGGAKTAGVAIMSNNKPALVLTTEAALRLAHRIADALQAVKK